MKGLSIIQPWASLIACGPKRYETRKWGTDYVGAVLIHASKSFPEHCRIFAESQRNLGRLTRELPLGAVVARAVLSGCYRTESVRDSLGPVELDLGDYSDGRYAFLLSQVEPLAEPIPWSGMLGLWNVPEKLLSLVNAQLSGKT